MLSMTTRWVLTWGLLTTATFAADDPPISAESTRPAEPVPAVPATDMVRVPDGFEVVEYASDQIAHDVFSMTVDSLGRVVVAGPGYVRILIDSNGDGRADTVKQFADSPKNGAQGLFFHGRSLLAVGDAGLLRYRDTNGDDVADGPPDVLIRLKTGGEHDAHSIQQGPDGWWYLIAGNTSEVTSNYATLPTSPVKQPRAGVILRFQPDLSKGEIYADGIRNAYDFAINAQGDLFTFDSDDERDISLPWYRPTRVFQVFPGSDMGWLSRSWKRPNYYFDMPPVMGSFGRGSPTGLVSYQHTQFPDAYRGALFALDWTYGRVLCLKMRPAGSTWTATSEVFMSGIGGYGFAPTDVAVGPDGSLYISVGGRGTRGGVYRIRAKDRVATSLAELAPLDAVLRAPQPLASWSRAQWLPKARSLKKEEFVQAVLDGQRSADERVRAIEILTEVHGGLDAATVHLLAAVQPPEVRARAIWSYGRTQGSQLDPAILLPYLSDRDAKVNRAALEAMQGIAKEIDASSLVPAIATLLGSNDRYNRSLAAAVVARLPDTYLSAFSKAATAHSARAVVSYAAGWIAQVGGDLSRIRPAMTPVSLAILSGDYPPDLKLDTLRLLQWMLGDMGPSERHPPAFDGYAPGIDPAELERDWDELRGQLAELYPTGQPLIDTELSRVLAMLAPSNQKLIDRLLAPITAESHPVDDIHQLLVVARIPVPRTTDQRQKIAEALVGIDGKFLVRKLPQDSSWSDRMKDLFQALASQDEFLAPVMVDVSGFGRPGHVLFMSEMPERRLHDAVQAFVTQIETDKDYPWTNDVVFLLGYSSEPAHRQLIRQQVERFAVQGAVLMTLAESPEPEERPLLHQGLESSQMEVVQACLSGLEQLPANPEPAEQLALLKALRRLGQDSREMEARERVVRLLERNTNHSEPFVFGKDGHRPQPDTVRLWTEWCSRQWPAETTAALGGEGVDLEQLRKLLAEIDWSQGDVARGGQLYHSRSCAQCHGGRSALGPDLSGIAGRFSKEDLFIAIVLPSRDVSSRYQTTIIETEQGQVYSGLIVYESVDGLLLRNATHQTFRIETTDIAERRKSPVSLMPAGLLKDLQPRDYADLYAYLASLNGGRPAATAAVNTGD